MFVLSADQRRLREELRAFADREIRPVAVAWDRSGRFPAELVAKIRERGYNALPFSKELGGAGLGLTEGLLFLEEISRGLGSIGFTMAAHVFQCCYALVDWVTPAQREAWLIPAIACEKLLAFALSEESGGSDVLGISTIAVRRPDGWLINGSKCWTTNVGVADGYIVAARTSSSSRNRSVSLFYVDARTPGLEISGRDEMLGLNNSPTGSLRLHDCLIPSDAMLGVGNEGYQIIKNVLKCGRLALSAVAVGIAQAAMELAVRYTGERTSFDRVISTYQGVSFAVADMFTRITLARNMVYHAAALVESGQHASAEIAALKLFSSEMCQETCKNALQLFGGRGYVKSFEVERLLRDSFALTTAEGTSQICRLIIANSVYNAQADPDAGARA